jgi:hypothetical protein
LVKNLSFGFFLLILRVFAGIFKKSALDQRGKSYALRADFLNLLRKIL